MGVHFHKRKSSVSLEASLDHVAEVLEKWDKVILSGVGRQIADIAGRLPCRSLCDNHVIALDPVGWEMVVTEGSGWGHAHCRHGLLLRN